MVPLGSSPCGTLFFPVRALVFPQGSALFSDTLHFTLAPRGSSPFGTLLSYQVLYYCRTCTFSLVPGGSSCDPVTPSWRPTIPRPSGPFFPIRTFIIAEPALLAWFPEVLPVTLPRCPAVSLREVSPTIWFCVLGFFTFYY